MMYAWPAILVFRKDNLGYQFQRFGGMSHAPSGLMLYANLHGQSRFGLPSKHLARPKAVERLDSDDL